MWLSQDKQEHRNKLIVEVAFTFKGDIDDDLFNMQCFVHQTFAEKFKNTDFAKGFDACDIDILDPFGCNNYEDQWNLLQPGLCSLFV